MGDGIIVFFAVFIVLALIAVGMWGCPTYNVWYADMDGRAELRKAEQNRQIRIAEAEANLEAQRLNAEAEVERAKGMAKAMEIENGQLTTHYIQYLFTRGLTEMAEKGDLPVIIYLPNDGVMPINEATRLPRHPMFQN
jgi:regulator of protease activity HflC (stomatin/prohibitin superfamily)